MSRWPIVSSGVVRRDDGWVGYIWLSILGWGVQIRHESMWAVLIQEYCTHRWNRYVGAWNVALYGKHRASDYAPKG